MQLLRFLLIIIAQAATLVPAWLQSTLGSLRRISGTRVEASHRRCQCD